ncbi:MAG: carbohydrate ABC transporter permease [Clostridiaceae bacterium]|nr:carbohydrate ABC transporter permease [Clostridiaceae bacterium]
MKRKNGKDILVQFFCIMTAIALLFPILYALSVSFMENRDILSRTPHILPVKVTFENYKTALFQTLLPRYIINSFVIATVCGVSRIIIGSMAAYAFAFYEFKGKAFLFSLTLATMMIPVDVLMISNYTTISKLGWMNTYLAVCVVFLVNGNNIFLMRQQFLTFAKSMREAAYVDGCGSIQFFIQILLPINKPIITTVFISSFVGVWNQYVWPMIVTNKDEMRTVQVGITMLKNWDSMIFGPVMAGVIIALIPTIFIIVVFQKKIVAGMMTGAVKE